MREILFRGKRVGDGQWVEGGFHIWETRMPCVVGADRLKPEEIKTMITVNSFADWNMPRTMQAVEVDPVTVGQYTGLTDKNGKRIFEGDVLKKHGSDKGYWLVSFCEGAFEVVGSLCSGSFRDDYSADNFEVVGNIHDTLNCWRCDIEI